MKIIATCIAACLTLTAVSASPRLAPQPQQRGAGPSVVFSTLMGGAAGNYDVISDLAVDAAGNAYVVGTTESSDFPTKNALQPSLKGDRDAFVAKFAPDGTLVWSTFLGGTEGDSGDAIAVDSAGAVYVAGSAGPGFPVKNAFQPAQGSFSDAFVAKIAPDGRSIEFASYLGGNQSERVADLALDTFGGIYVAGTVFGRGATSVTFPLVNPIQQAYGGGDEDAFASFIAPGGTAIMFSTLLDAGVKGDIGAGTDRVSSILVDSSSGDVFLAGNVEIDENEPEEPFVGRFRPAVPRPADDALRAPPQAVYTYIELLNDRINNGDLEPPEEFGVKLSIFWMAGLTGSFRDNDRGAEAPEILVLAEGLCHPATPARNCDEPAALAAFDSDLGFKRATNVPALREFFYDMGTVDRTGALYIAGDISSDRLTAVDPVQGYGGNDDAVVAAIAPGASSPAFATFFGGDGFDLPTAIAVDADGNIYVAGLTTLSTTFPTTPGALQATPKGRNDGFLVKMSRVPIPDFSVSFDPASITVARGSKITVPIEIERLGGFAGRVTVTSPATVPGIKLPKKPISTTGDAANLKIKVKANAPTGPQQFTFTARDESGRTRTATLTLTVE
jgi:hypothetical protein